jgi:hypothetical protein
MTELDENDWSESELKKVVGFAYNFYRIINDCLCMNALRHKAIILYIVCSLYIINVTMATLNDELVAKAFEVARSHSWIALAESVDEKTEFTFTTNRRTHEDIRQQNILLSNFKHGKTHSMIKVIDRFTKMDTNVQYYRGQYVNPQQTISFKNDGAVYNFNDDSEGIQQAIKYFCFRALQYKTTFMEDISNHYKPMHLAQTMIRIPPLSKPNEETTSDYLTIERWIRGKQGEPQQQQVFCDISYFNVSAEYSEFRYYNYFDDLIPPPTILSVEGLQQEIKELKSMVTILHDALFNPGSGVVYKQHEQQYNTKKRNIGSLDEDEDTNKQPRHFITFERD